MKSYKKIPKKKWATVINEVKLMIAAHRDCLWTRWETCASPSAVDPTKVSIMANEGFYGEAFGIMRGLRALDYGYFGSSNLSAVQEDKSPISEHNLIWWFERIVKDYLEEEGFKDQTCSPQRCQLLLEKYRKLTAKKN